MDVFRLIDRRDKLSLDKWKAWALEIGLSDGTVDGAASLLADADLWQESEELCQVFATAEAFGVADYLVYDASIVRGLDYYTGPVFEAYDRERKFRAIFGGGRYDNLVADVGGDRITGVGFAMGDVIIELLLERAGKRPELPLSPSRVLVTLFRRRSVSPDPGPGSRAAAGGHQRRADPEAGPPGQADPLCRPQGHPLRGYPGTGRAGGGPGGAEEPGHGRAAGLFGGGSHRGYGMPDCCKCAARVSCRTQRFAKRRCSDRSMCTVPCVSLHIDKVGTVNRVLRVCDPRMRESGSFGTRVPPKLVCAGRMAWSKG